MRRTSTLSAFLLRKTADRLNGHFAVSKFHSSPKRFHLYGMTRYGSRRGKPKRILEMAIEGEIEVAISDPIIAEIRRHLLGKFGWSEARVAEAIETISEFARRVSPTETIDGASRDSDDDRMLECAVAAGSEVIVSGDLDLLTLGSFCGIQIVKVSDFLARARGR